MVEKLKPSRVVFNVLNYGFMILFAFICIVPIWHVIMASISDPRLLMNASGIIWTPLGDITFDGYGLVFQNKSVLIGYANTLLYVVWNTVVGTLFTVIAGYLVSRKDFKMAKPLMYFILVTMMFSGGLIPTYQVIRALGLINTRWALMLPGLLNAFYITMMKSAFEQLSESYEESAKLDGAGPLTIMFKILAPLVKANIAVIAMFTVVTQWNSWYTASIYLPAERDLWPLQLFMREILIKNDTAALISGSDVGSVADYTSNLVKYCVVVVGTLPVLCAYPFAQQYFVKGVTLGGVKG